MFSVEVLAIVAVAFLVAGVVKGVVGLGLPIISIAILAATIGLKSAVAIFLIPALATNLWQAFSGGNFVVLVKRLWPMFITAVVGIWFGVKILSTANSKFLSIALGIILLAYAVIGLTRATMPRPGNWEPWLTPIVGAAGGVMFGMMGNFMVPGVLYIQSLGLSRDGFVQALGITFLVISTALVFALQRHALMPLETAAVSAFALLPALIGVLIGQRVRQRLSEALFAKIVLAAIGFAGAYMILRAAIAAF